MNSVRVLSARTFSAFWSVFTAKIKVFVYFVIANSGFTKNFCIFRIIAHISVSSELSPKLATL